MHSFKHFLFKNKISFVLMTVLSLNMNSSDNKKPIDTSKPSYYLYQADLILKKISDQNASDKEINEIGLKIEKFLNSNAEYLEKNPKLLEALKNKEIDLARAASLRKSLNKCESDRGLSGRILNSALAQPTDQSLCQKNSHTNSFSQIQNSITPITEKLDNNQIRPDLLELREKVYLESLTNGIKNQLEIDFALHDYPRNSNTVHKVINHLISKRCQIPKYCHQKNKDEIIKKAYNYALSSGFTNGQSVVTNQKVIDQFCQKFNAYPEVKLHQSSEIQNNKKLNQQKNRIDIDNLRVPKKDGQIADMNSLPQEKYKKRLSVIYRNAALDMMKKGGLGLLFMGGKSGDEFQIPFNCKNPEDKENVKQLEVIRNNLKTGLDVHAERMSAAVDPKVQLNHLVKNQLAELIKSNPGSFAQVIASNPNLAISTCDIINTVQSADLRQQKVDTALMIGGMVVAGVLISTGVGAAFVAAGAELAVGAVTLSGTVAAMASISGAIGWAGAGVSALSLSNNLNKYYIYDQEFQNQTLSVISTNGKKYGNADDASYDESKSNQKKSNKALVDAAGDAVDVVLSPVGAKVVEELNQYNKSKQVSQVLQSEEKIIQVVNKEIPDQIKASAFKDEFKLGSDAVVQINDESQAIGKIISTEKDAIGNKVYTIQFIENGETKLKKVYQQSLSASHKSKGITVQDFINNGLTEQDFQNKLQKGSAVFVKRTKGNFTRAQIIEIKTDSNGNLLYLIEGTEKGQTYQKFVNAKQLNLQTNVTDIYLRKEIKKAVDITQIPENNKLKKMAIAVEDKMDVKVVQSAEANETLKSEGYFDSSTDWQDTNLGLTKKNQKVLNISKSTVEKGIPGSTEFHEIGHAKTAMNIENNIQDPMGVDFYPENGTIKGYENFAGADESRQHAIDFMKYMRDQSEKEVVELYNQKQKTSIFNFFSNDKKVPVKDLFPINKDAYLAENSLDYIKKFNSQNSKMAEDAIESLNDVNNMTVYTNAVQINTPTGKVSIPFTPEAINDLNIKGDASVSKIKDYVRQYLNKTQSMYKNQSQAVVEAEKYYNEIMNNPLKKITKEEYHKIRSAFSKVKTTVNIKPK